MLILLVLELIVTVHVASLGLNVRLPSLNAVTTEVTHQTHVSMVDHVWIQHQEIHSVTVLTALLENSAKQVGETGGI